MKNLDNITKIKKLAKQFGTPLISVDFIGNGMIFYYQIGDTVYPHNYSNADKGLEEELTYLENLSKIEI